MSPYENQLSCDEVLKNKTIILKKQKITEPLEHVFHKIKPSGLSLYYTLDSFDFSLIVQGSEKDFISNCRDLEILNFAAFQSLVHEAINADGLHSGHYAREIFPQKNLICHDFLIDPFQVFRYRYFEFNTVAIYPSIIPGDWEELNLLCKERTLETILFVRNRKEIERAIHSPARIIALNEKDLLGDCFSFDEILDYAQMIPNSRKILSFLSFIDENRLEKIREAEINGVILHNPDKKTIHLWNHFVS